jgi:hypothetical protein
MNINFFVWIREGVKQAVLHGVSDAVGHLGPTTLESDDMPQRILEVLRQSPTLSTTSPRIDGGSAPKSKRLGRTLEQVVSEKNAS